MFLAQSATFSFLSLYCPKSPQPPGNNQGKALVNRLLSSSYSFTGLGETYGNSIVVLFLLLCWFNPSFSVSTTGASFSLGKCGAMDGKIPRADSISHPSCESPCKPDKVCN